MREWWRGCVAARGARTAAGDAGDWVYPSLEGEIIPGRAERESGALPVAAEARAAAIE